MQHKRIIIFALSCLPLFIFFSGIIRHDVKEEEYIKLAQEKQFDCVGQVLKDTAIGGSCVLIGDRYAISAAHVFIDTDSRIDTVQIEGSTIINSLAINDRETDVSKLFLLFNGEKFKVKRLLIHPNYNNSLTKGSCDIALIELEAPVSKIIPAKLNINYDELNSDVVGVGYGASGPADRPDMVALLNKKIAGENVVDSITGYEYSGFKTILLCDFDHPNGKGCNKMGSPLPQPLEYISSGGDSGGALFRKTGKEWALIGICTGGGIDYNQFMKTFYYGQIMEWTRVSAFAKWISVQSKQ
jgi:hypothetical protein